MNTNSPATRIGDRRYVLRVTLVLFAGLLVLINGATDVSAGMPTFTLADAKRPFSRVLSEPTRLRLDSISFFLLGLLVSTWIIRRTWNSLRQEFPRLPLLSFGKAFRLVMIWGLLFVVVLTMISGARELMTPGAWEKQGLTYRLAPSQPDPIEEQITARYAAMQRLRDSVFAYASKHDEQLPTPKAADEILTALGPSATSAYRRYVYVGGGKIPDEHSQHLTTPCAYEGDAVGPDRLVLMTNGGIRWMPITEIERTLKEPIP